MATLVMHYGHMGPMDLLEGLGFNTWISNMIFEETAVRLTMRAREQRAKGKTNLAGPVEKFSKAMEQPMPL